MKAAIRIVPLLRLLVAREAANTVTYALAGVRDDFITRTGH